MKRQILAVLLSVTAATYAESFRAKERYIFLPSSVESDLEYASDEFWYPDYELIQAAEVDGEYVEGDVFLQRSTSKGTTKYMLRVKRMEDAANLSTEQIDEAAAVWELLTPAKGSLNGLLFDPTSEDGVALFSCKYHGIEKRLTIPLSPQGGHKAKVCIVGGVEEENFWNQCDDAAIALFTDLPREPSTCYQYCKAWNGPDNCGDEGGAQFRIPDALQLYDATCAPVLGTWWHTTDRIVSATTNSQGKVTNTYEKEKRTHRYAGERGGDWHADYREIAKIEDPNDPTKWSDIVRVNKSFVNEDLANALRPWAILQGPWYGNGLACIVAPHYAIASTHYLKNQYWWCSSRTGGENIEGYGDCGEFIYRNVADKSVTGTKQGVIASFDGDLSVVYFEEAFPSNMIQKFVDYRMWKTLSPSMLHGALGIAMTGHNTIFPVEMSQYLFADFSGEKTKFYAGQEVAQGETFDFDWNFRSCVFSIPQKEPILDGMGWDAHHKDLPFQDLVHFGHTGDSSRPCGFWTGKCFIPMGLNWMFPMWNTLCYIGLQTGVCLQSEDCQNQIRMAIEQDSLDRTGVRETISYFTREELLEK